MYFFALKILISAFSPKTPFKKQNQIDPKYGSCIKLYEALKYHQWPKLYGGKLGNGVSLLYCWLIPDFQSPFWWIWLASPELTITYKWAFYNSTHAPKQIKDYPVTQEQVKGITLSRKNNQPKSSILIY